MKYFKEISKFFIIIFLSILILSSLSYFNILNEEITYIVQLIVLFITIFIFSFSLGRKSQKDGYLEGLKFGGLISLLFIIIRIILFRNITIKKIVYYILIIIVSMIGSILGINKKTKA